MLLIACDVLGRNLFGRPISGVPELVSLTIVAIVFLQAPQALKAGRMTRSDALAKVLEARAPRLSAAVNTLFDLIAEFAQWLERRREFVAPALAADIPIGDIDAVGHVEKGEPARRLSRFRGGERAESE